ncbi:MULTISPECIES: hypothetical protein [unclassified Streptomyces]|uniref:hypothetical protein n=1 Tax=unclassified Streptomyces TaxID=2593676 RepID=UPI000C26E125|nr:hypothetical protein [Streptomyces sp. CB02959]PJN34620.1 hypothetical protein CG747_38790 [Streptomyces sp. CB02959]
MSVAAVETYETRTPDAEGWRGIPFRRPRDGQVVAQDDGGKHDGGPMPPEAPRDPQPQGGDGACPAASRPLG